MIKHKEINIIRALKDIKSDAELARRLNLTPANFQSLLNKKTGLTQADLIRIADALGVRYVSAFIDENGQTLAGGVCDVSELEEIDRKPTGAAAHKSKLNAPKDTK
ncbi:MAG TPA: helix-turn-helix transcriptional regulator [Candidatus Borkfalkia avistercoris]|uniref:Helix-turn-helix transcriptional regulator n=1 Tax=Candidatus Borkfalkia avistercoris TaxID=2838504 RepID=A0A9D2CZR8_9FIRM|nr:helix-turn-helix transcriptional regulator [Candidatus Borkfalkia avistercoris]